MTEETAECPSTQARIARIDQWTTAYNKNAESGCLASSNICKGLCDTDCAKTGSNWPGSQPTDGGCSGTCVERCNNDIRKHIAGPFFCDKICKKEFGRDVLSTDCENAYSLCRDLLDTTDDQRLEEMFEQYRRQINHHPHHHHHHQPDEEDSDDGYYGFLEVAACKSLFDANGMYSIASSVMQNEMNCQGSSNTACNCPDKTCFDVNIGECVACPTVGGNCPVDEKTGEVQKPNGTTCGPDQSGKDICCTGGSLVACSDNVTIRTQDILERIPKFMSSLGRNSCRCQDDGTSQGPKVCADAGDDADGSPDIKTGSPSATTKTGSPSATTKTGSPSATTKTGSHYGASPSALYTVECLCDIHCQNNPVFGDGKCLDGFCNASPAIEFPDGDRCTYEKKGEAILVATKTIGTHVHACFRRKDGADMWVPRCLGSDGDCPHTGQICDVANLLVDSSGNRMYHCRIPGGESGATGATRENRDTTPANNKRDTPANNKRDTPANNKGDTPANNKRDTPANNKRDSATSNNRDNTTSNNRDSATSNNRDTQADSPVSKIGNTPVSSKGDAPESEPRDGSAPPPGPAPKPDENGSEPAVPPDTAPQDEDASDAANMDTDPGDSGTWECVNRCPDRNLSTNGARCQRSTKAPTALQLNSDQNGKKSNQNISHFDPMGFVSADRYLCNCMCTDEVTTPDSPECPTKAPGAMQ